VICDGVSHQCYLWLPERSAVTAGRMNGSSMPDMATFTDPHDDYDPSGPETFDSIHEDFRTLRSRCPVAHSSAFDGFWAVARYDDVMEILSNPELYITSVRNVVPGSSATGRRPPLHLDLPEHTPYRRAIDRALRPARVAAIEPATRRIAARLAADLVARREADFVEHFFDRTFCYLVGIHLKFF